MILDATLGLSSNQAITVTAPSTGIIDLTGLGVGMVANSTNLIFGETTGQATVPGYDAGIGDGVSPPVLICIVGTAFTAAGAATLQPQLQAAIDDGTGNPSTWDTIAEQDAYAKTLLTAGKQIAEFTLPHRYPGQGFPRFYRINYVVATGPFTAGTIAYAGINTGRDNTPFYSANF